MRGNLEHAVSRRVDDRFPGLHVLDTELVDDRGTACGLVGKRAATNSPLEPVDQLPGKAIRKNRKSALEHQARQLPMSRYRVLAGRCLSHAAKRAHRIGLAGHT